MANAIVHLNVGGTFFDVDKNIFKNEPDCMLARMFSGLFNNKLDAEGRIYIFREGKYFHYIIDYLRDGKISIDLSDKTAIEELLAEADYYSIDSLVTTLEQLRIPTPWELNIKINQYLTHDKIATMKKLYPSRFTKYYISIIVDSPELCEDLEKFSELDIICMFQKNQCTIDMFQGKCSTYQKLRGEHEFVIFLRD